MSRKEVDRLEIIRRVVEKRLTQGRAGVLAQVTARQVRRWCKAYRRHGPAGLVSRRRGKASNRRLPEDLREGVLSLVRERYADFGPTLAREKLWEEHRVGVGRETLRKWMAAEGIWVPRAQRSQRPHPPRHRRECYGELVQIDGCQHEWFEERGPKCTLLVFVDDATGRLMELCFVACESAFDYFASTRRYLERHGKPVAFYSDKHSIFRAYTDGATGRNKGVTQFGRALGELNIDILCANTPQAKGRVERVHQTLQDRLVKELRLRGICTPEAGNAFLPEFMADYNRRFERPPKNPHDAHRPLRGDEDLGRIFSWQEERVLTRNLTVHFKRVTYLVQPGPETTPLGGKTVRVHQWADGRVEIRHGELSLPYSVFDKNPHVTQSAIVENKRLAAALLVIRAAQEERDRARLGSPALTLREKARLRAAREQAGLVPPPAVDAAPRVVRRRRFRDGGILDIGNA